MYFSVWYKRNHYLYQDYSGRKDLPGNGQLKPLSFYDTNSLDLAATAAEANGDWSAFEAIKWEREVPGSDNLSAPTHRDMAGGAPAKDGAKSDWSALNDFVGDQYGEAYCKELGLPEPDNYDKVWAELAIAGTDPFSQASGPSTPTAGKPR